MRFLALLIGAILGSATLEMGGVPLGALVGWLLYESWKHRGRIKDLEAEVARLVVQLAALGAAPPTAPTERPVAEERADAPADAPVEAPTEAPVVEPDEGPSYEPVAEPVGEPFEEPVGEEATPIEIVEGPAGEAPGRPGAAAWPVEAWWEPVRSFLFGGNTLVRLGLLVLFFGFAFLVRYAAESDLFPIELRLAAVALAGAALFGVGWWLRERRAGYGLALQGGGIALCYLTIFAAFRLYDLLPAGAAFGLLVAVAVFGAAVAVLQDAQGLAVVGLLGGFFAPVLASTGAGSHVALFGYYAVLNVGLFGIAWFKAWRVLTLVGFVCTFGIASVWGGLSYEPTLFRSTEPFLILFFLLYFGMSAMHAWRHRADLTRIVDGTLVFGLPVVVISLQAVLVQALPYGLAWSAFALGVFYAATAWLIYRRAPDTLHLLVESYAGVGLALGTMVLPFALDATWTGTGWALEGGALVWLGVRQRRLLLRASGLLLQLAAAWMFFQGPSSTAAAEALPLLNARYFGFLALSLAALFTAYYLYARSDRVRAWEVRLVPVFLGLGLVWWLAGGIGEIWRETPEEAAVNLTLIFAALTALACAVLRERLHWPAPGGAAKLLLPVLYLLLVMQALILEHPFEAGGWAAWLVALAGQYLILYRLEQAGSPNRLGLLHGATLWLVALIGVWASFEGLDRLLPDATVWPQLGFALLPVALVYAVVRAAPGTTWPIGTHSIAYLTTGAGPVVAAVWAWSIYASLGESADPAPLPYVPLLNPLDVVLGLALVTAILWMLALRRLAPDLAILPPRRWTAWVAVGTVFLWLNATLARTVHHVLDVPYTEALFDEPVYQTALSIFWTVLAVATMGIAARRGARSYWLAGAVLLGIVVIKLFVVDLSSISTVARIVSFIVVGLLLLLVGYVAPLPPRTAGDGEALPSPEPPPQPPPESSPAPSPDPPASV